MSDSQEEPFVETSVEGVKALYDRRVTQRVEGLTCCDRCSVEVADGGVELIGAIYYMRASVGRACPAHGPDSADVEVEVAVIDKHTPRD